AVAVVGVVNEVAVADLGPARRPAENGSAAWRAASAAVAQALRDGAPALVIGEPGSGRFTLVAELHRSAREDGRAVGIAPERVAAAPEEVAAAIAAAGPAVLYVLRDVDGVPAAAGDTRFAAGGAGVPPASAAPDRPPPAASR